MDDTEMNMRVLLWFVTIPAVLVLAMVLLAGCQMNATLLPPQITVSMDVEFTKTVVSAMATKRHESATQPTGVVK
jgi:uncharacterized lipoprotein YajG